MDAPATPDPLPFARAHASAGVQENALGVFDAVASAPIGIAVLDRELRFVHVNRWIAQADGVAVEAHAGRTLGEILPALDLPVAPLEARLRSVVETGDPCTFPVAVVRDGARREWIATCFPLLGEDGDVRGVCGVVVDVTADREREAAEARARVEAEQLARRIVYLQDVIAARSSGKASEAVAQEVVERARRLVGAVAATFRVVRGGALELLAASAEPGVTTPSQSVPLDARLPVTAALSLGEPVWLGSREAIDARFPDAAPAHDATRAIAALPLGFHPGPVGTLAFVFDRPRAFGPEDRALFLGIADQAAQAVERALLHAGERAAHAAAERANARLARLQAITAALSGASTAEEVAQHLADGAHGVLGADSAVVFLVEAGRATLRLGAVAGRAAACRVPLARIAFDRALPPARAAQTGEACWLETREAVRGAFPEVAEAVPYGAEIAAMAALPLRARGEVLGALGFAFATERTFGTEERELLSSVADQGAQALDRARLLDDERRARGDAERARAEADRARALLDAMVENAPLGIGFFDREFRYQRVNPKLAGMNGVPAPAHVGRRPRELLPGVPVDELEAVWRRVLETGEPMMDVEVRGETAASGGRRVWVQSWYPVRAGRETIGVGALVRDVTREREAEEFQRHVVGVVGHDLRNPLSAILTATSLLGRAGLPPRPARLVGQVERSAWRLEEIVRALLDYARVRGGAGVPLARRRCDLAEIARAVADECALARPGRQVRCEGDPECAGEWDADRIGQLLTNLVSNALDHGPKDAPVRVRWRRAGEDVVLEVENGGSPIPPEILPRLFEPFRRGDGGGRGGVGLGLFIARAIAAAHGGAIDVRSSAEEGTVFSVRLPSR